MKTLLNLKAKNNNNATAYTIGMFNFTCLNLKVLPIDLGKDYAYTPEYNRRFRC